MTHLWQRFLLASALVVGLAIGVAATVFGYSNLATVDIHWSVFRLNGVPLWTVAVVPITLLLVAGTLYHWMDGLHHFSEHMRHRRRVHELEAEITSLRAHLDHVLEMPDHSTSRLPSKPVTAEVLPADTAPANGTETRHRAERSKRARLAAAEAAEPIPAPVATDGGREAAAAESAAGA